jgi:hypothetical protein
MNSAYKRAIATACFCALCCAHPLTYAEEAKPDSTAQSGVAAQGTQDQSKDVAKPAKADEAKKKSGDAEPECNN